MRTHLLTVRATYWIKGGAAKRTMYWNLVFRWCQRRTERTYSKAYNSCSVGCFFPFNLWLCRTSVQNSNRKMWTERNINQVICCVFFSISFVRSCNKTYLENKNIRLNGKKTIFVVFTCHLPSLDHCWSSIYAHMRTWNRKNTKKINNDNNNEDNAMRCVVYNRWVIVKHFTT